MQYCVMAKVAYVKVPRDSSHDGISLDLGHVI